MISQSVVVLGRTTDFASHVKPLNSTWPHMTCDVGLEEGDINRTVFVSPWLSGIFNWRSFTVLCSTTADW